MKRSELKGSYSAPAIAKAFEIIEMLSEKPGGALVSEMALDLGRSVGELFRIVVVLEQLGYLQKSAATDRYTVAYKMLDLAFRATPAQHLVRAAVTQMPELARDTGQSCHLVIPCDTHGLVVAREEDPGTRGFALRVGAHIDLIRSCSGQVILAFSLPEIRSHLIDAARGLNFTAAERLKLESGLEKVRADRMDSRPSPIIHGVTDISVPVFGFDGAVRAALTIPFLALIDGSQKMDLALVKARLRAAAAAISTLLGFHEDVMRLGGEPQTSPSIFISE